MKLTIIYDNEVFVDGLESKWGFSCLIEVAEHKILFDTGGDDTILLNNMRKLRINPEEISDVFISHGHWDHTGGLAGILRLNEDAMLYIPSSALNLKIPGLSERGNVVVIKESQRIYDNIYSTGELEKIEQSLIINTPKGLVIVVGCSHPGVGKILEAASEFGNIYGIIGGLHSFNDFYLLKDIELICPTHCTKYSSKIKSLYPEKCINGGAGKVIEI
jgi:7,8-dihydropterin-6-yl-methyl-4-(beta-D-ribofuranosyl)aminobenzene 5'-phosphate synthase